MGGYHHVPDTNPQGDCTNLPLFNVFWICVDSKRSWEDEQELDLLVTATCQEHAIQLAKEQFPNKEPRHWGADPIRFNEAGVHML